MKVKRREAITCDGGDVGTGIGPTPQAQPTPTVKNGDAILVSYLFSV